MIISDPDEDEFELAKTGEWFAVIVFVICLIMTIGFIYLAFTS